MPFGAKHNRSGPGDRTGWQHFVSLLPALCMCLAVGCAAWTAREPLVTNPLVDEYREYAENKAIPNLDAQQIPMPRLGGGRPLVPYNQEDLRPISLVEAIDFAVRNNKILRQNAQFLSPTNPVMVNPDGVPSVYDPIIQNNGVLFGSRGVEAALSDFDPRLTINSSWGRDSKTGDSTIATTGPLGTPLNNDFWQFQSRLEQQTMSGGTFALKHDWTYSDSNALNQIYPNYYSGDLGVELRQPLWAGAGWDYTGVAGPIQQRARGFSNVSQGIVIARINSTLSQIDFEENIQNMLREVGDLYWELFQGYREYEVERGATEVTKRLFDALEGKDELVSAAEKAQAEDAYWEAKSREEQALDALFQSEARFRRLIGMPIDDGQLMYPSDLPYLDKIDLPRERCLLDAIRNRLEIRRQKTNLHSLELQHTAAEKLLNPRLDVVGGAALNGFGHNLFGPNSDGRTAQGFNSAYGSLFRGNQSSWNVGLEYSLPLWVRSERAQVRQLEFRIIKARAALAAQEDEISRELNKVFQTLEHWHTSLQTNRNRLDAAKRALIAARGEHLDTGRIAIDVVLKAQLRKTQAQLSYNRSLAEYNKAARDLLYRMGLLMKKDGVQILGAAGKPETDDDLLDGIDLRPSPDNPNAPPKILPHQPLRDHLDFTKNKERNRAAPVFPTRSDLSREDSVNLPKLPAGTPPPPNESEPNDPSDDEIPASRLKWSNRRSHFESASRFKTGTADGLTLP